MSNKKSGGFDIKDSLGFFIAKCHQKAFHIFREKLLPYNLTPPQFSVLAFLWKNDGQSQIQLGTALEMDRTTTSGIIDRMENQGLVIRRPNPEDRRVFMIYLTEAGREMEHTVSRLSHEANAEVAANLSAKEKETLLALLKKLRGDKYEE
ncbi:MarR family winged helix-turn-helix transcriptional regulator [Desulfoscipio gibsoniae]|uniref:Transcriptional regulator n=1 Tax=Desulfoscipio gibsoniae DSM 7213 TaxID=767817 RepID=R4KMK1_9FIRM|nr:MarR family transcriptional regulator [Desulfoscipio gibsoniae]AGL02787.1 transcriptional regulator [Desulfoscipio gibsoniae DSM 7213]